MTMERSALEPEVTPRKLTSGKGNNEQANAVTPPPLTIPALETTNCKISFSEMEFLCKFLGILNDTVQIKALDESLCALGCVQLQDLAFLQESDLKKTALSPMIQRKLLTYADFLMNGGSPLQFSSVRDLLVARQNATSSTNNTPLAATSASRDSDEDVTRLDVGGHKFTTTRSTLCRFPGSVLEAMFSGRHENHAKQQKDGTYVIDRNGMHFQHILDFLRVGAVISLPRDAIAREELVVEADYYGLTDLVRAIRMPQVDTTEHLPLEVLSMRQAEDDLRASFMSGTAKFFPPHRGLVSFFSPDDGVQPLPLPYEPTGDTGDFLMDNLRENPSPGTPVTAKSLEAFKSNFNREHPNLLHRLGPILLEEPIVIAGGAVLRALTSTKGVRTAKWWGDKSDVDLFLHCRDRAEANRIARRVFYALAMNNERWVVMRSRGVITMHNWVGDRWNSRVDLKVQIVLRIFDSPAEVLLGFDCDCCCCAYDGKSVWVTPRCVRALRTGVNMLNPLHAWPNKSSYELRLAKYAYRGFGVLVPGLDKTRVDYNRIRQTDLSKLKGLARLLKITFEMDTSPTHQSFPLAPLRSATLRRHARGDLNDAELLTRGMVSGYFGAVGDVLIPSVYGEGEPHNMLWYQYMGGRESDFPLARECRDEAWREIETGHFQESEGVPRMLLSSWDMEKRSREYINSEMDAFDRDNVYYGHAYESVSKDA